jgi:hypothetical protein
MAEFTLEQKRAIAIASAKAKAAKAKQDAIPTRMKAPEPTALETGGRIAAGLLTGAATIPEILLSPTGLTERGRTEEAFRQLMGIPQDSMAFGGGKMGGEVLATMGVPVAAARTVGRALPAAAKTPYVNKLLSAIETGGFGKMAGAPAGAPISAQAAQAAQNYMTRIAGGAIGGGITGAALEGDLEGAGMGAVIGGAVPAAVRPLAAGAGLAGKAAKAGLEKFEDIKAADKAKLAEVAGNKINDIIASLESQVSPVPGYQPQAGQAAIRAQSPAFSSLVENVLQQAKKDPEIGKILSDRDASNALALKMYQDGLFKTAEDAKKALSGIIPERSRADIGKVFPESRKKILEAEKAKVDPFYDAARAHKGGIDVTDMATAVRQVESRNTRFGTDLEPETLSLIERLRPTEVPGGYNKLTLGFDAPKTVPPTISMKEAIELDKRLGREYAMLQRSTDPGQRQTAMNVMDLKSQLDGILKRSVPKDVYESYTTGKKMYQKNIIEPFYQSEFEKMAKKGSLGQPMLQGSDVIKKVFAKPEYAQQFVRQFKDDPAAVAAASEGIEELFRGAVMKDGAINVDAAKKFLSKNSESLNILDQAGMSPRAKLEKLVSDTEAADSMIKKVSQDAKLLGDWNPNIATPEREAKIIELTQNLTPQQKMDFDAVKKVIDDEKEYKRLLKFGDEQSANVVSDKMPEVPPIMKVWATVSRRLANALGVAMDEKTNIQLAKTLIEPKLTAQALKDVKAWQATKAAKAAKLERVGQRMAKTGEVGARAGVAALQNSMAESRNRNSMNDMPLITITKGVPQRKQ